MTSESRVRVQLHITGIVQGVCYRASARDEAVELGLTGWVKNNLDGSVEALAEGPTEAIERFIAWCRRGPPSAEVEDVVCTRGAATGEFQRFAIAR